MKSLKWRISAFLGQVKKFWEKIPPCTFIQVALKFEIKSSKLKTACNFVKESKLVINNSTDRHLKINLTITFTVLKIRITRTIINWPENFHPARLLIFQKIFPLHVYSVLHVECFIRIFPPAHLFRPTRLFGTQEY